MFVTPEYNHGYPGSLKNALDRVYAEWNNKAAGFVAYGADGGVRAVEQLRQVVGTLKIADVAPQVAISLRDDFTGYSDFTPRDHQQQALTAMLDDLVVWADALRGRDRSASPTAEPPAPVASRESDSCRLRKARRLVPAADRPAVQ